MPSATAAPASTMPTTPASVFCPPDMSLFRNTMMISGRNATIATIAPSWFCTKNRTLSCFEAGSSRFARFQSTEPVIESAAMTTSSTMSAMNAHCGNS